MLTNLKIINAYSIKKINMSFIKGKYGYKMEMVEKEIVNPIVIYGNNGSGKSSFVNAMNDLLNLLIADKDKFYPLIPHFNNKKEESIIELSIKLDEDEYVYCIYTNFERSLISKEVLLLNNKPIFTRNEERIIIEDKEYEVESELLLGLRQLYGDLESLHSYKNNIKEVYDYLVNMAIVKTDSSIYTSSLYNYKNMDELLVENSEEIKRVLSTFSNFPIYDFYSENANYYLNLYFKNKELKLPGFLISDGMLAASKILSLLVNLKRNSLLIIDGVEKSLHTSTILNLVKEAKKREIQLMFTSHNTTLMQELRPDQIYFARNKEGYSYYFRLSNIYDNIREINNIEKMYLSNTFEEKINEIISID